MGWRIIYIEDAERVCLYLDNIKITKPCFGEITIPLSDIHTLIIDNPKISVTVQLLNKCCEYNINTLMCSIDHMPSVVVNPFIGNRQQALMIRRQLKWSESCKKYMHMLIIKNKIRNQRRLLEYLNKDYIVINRLLNYEKEVDLGDSLNREGLAAKSYFRELFGDKFKRFNDDVINAGLNYGYSILRSQITKTVFGKGLNPTFGIIHYGPENAYNLSDDIIESFRPIIDTYAYKYLFDAMIFKKEHKLDLIKTTTKYCIYGETKQTLFNVIGMYIDSIIYYFDTGDFSRILDIRIPYEEI